MATLPGLPELPGLMVEEAIVAAAAIKTSPPLQQTNHHDQQQEQHQQQQVEAELFSCVTCGKSYSSKASLIVHANLHSYSRSFPCHLCPKSFLRRSTLYNHKKSHQAKETNFKCTVCNAVQESELKLMEHEKTHTDKNGVNNYEVECFVCAAILSTEIGLKLHIIQMHPEIVVGKVEKTFKCEVCNKKYATCTYLKQHMKTHTAAKKHSCPHCKYAALTKDALQRHVDRIHLNLRKFECVICGKKFVSQPDRKLHMLRHYKVKPVNCDECNQSFYSTRELRKHKWAHTGQKPFSCSVCSVSYAYVESLRSHKAAHFEQPSKCRECPGLELWSKKAVSNHARGHANTGSAYKCRDCGRLYKSHGRLHAHQTKEGHNCAVYMCHHCGLEFSQLVHLKEHDTKMKHGFSCFQCAGCEKVFEDENLFLDHIDDEHGTLEEVESVFYKFINNLKSERTGDVKQESCELICERVIQNENDSCEIELSTGGEEMNSRLYVSSKTSVDHEKKDNESTDSDNMKVCEVSLSHSDYDSDSEDGSSLDEYEGALAPAIEGVEVAGGEDAGVFECSMCEKLFPTQGDCQEHVVHTHGGGEGVKR